MLSMFSSRTSAANLCKKPANASYLVIKIFRLKNLQKEYYVRFEELDGTASQKKAFD